MTIVRALPLLVLVASGLPAPTAPLEEEPASPQVRAADVPCESWTFQGYRLEMSAAEARAVHGSKGLRPGMSFSANRKTLQARFAVGSKREGWSGTVTLKQDRLAKLNLHYKELELDELIADLRALYGEPILEGEQRHFKSHRCDTIVIAEKDAGKGSRITLQSISDHVVEKYKKKR